MNPHRRLDRGAAPRGLRRLPPRRAALGRWVVAAILAVVALVGASCAVESPRNGPSPAAVAGPGSSHGTEASDDPAVAVGGADTSGVDAASGAAGPAVEQQGSEGSGAGTPGSPGTSGTPGVAPTGAAGGRPAGSAAGAPITVSVSMPLSGPFGVYYRPIYESSFEVWQKDINSRGGIGGRPVDLKAVDDKGTSDGAIAACKEAQSNGSVLVFIAYGLRTEGDCLERAGIPAVFGQVGDPNPSWTRVRVVDSPPNDAVALATFVKTQLGGDRRKIGVIHTADDVSAIGLAANFKTEAQRLGMNVVATEKVGGQQATFTSELIRLRNAGAEIVAMLVLFEGIGIVRDAKAMRYEPIFTGTTFTTDTTAQAARDLWSGIKALRAFSTIDTPAYAAFEKTAKRYNAPIIDTSSMALYGWALVTQRLLEAAGDSPTRAGIQAAFPSVRGFDSGIWPLLSWERDLIGSNRMYPVVCCGPNYTWRSLGPARDRF